MDESLPRLWQVCIWYFGISATVTIALFGWLVNIQSRIAIGESINTEIKKLCVDVSEIKDALKGSYDKKGLITKHYDLETRIEKLETQNG